MISYPEYVVGQEIITLYFRGKITEVIDGWDKGWTCRRYYMVKPNRISLPTHLVSDAEVLQSVFQNEFSSG